eukprot:1276636-Prymnesium_polylepis.1
MSNSDTINQQQERAEKVTQIVSMCVMVKGKHRPTLDSLGVSGSIAFSKSTKPPTTRSSRT